MNIPVSSAKNWCLDEVPLHPCTSWALDSSTQNSPQDTFRSICAGRTVTDKFVELYTPCEMKL